MCDLMCDASLAGRLNALPQPSTVHLIVLSSDGNFVRVGVADVVVVSVVSGVEVPVVLDFVFLADLGSSSSSSSEGALDNSEEA